MPCSSRFPKLHFLVVDAQPGAPPKRHARNIHRIVFKAEQAAYMAGYLSALMAARGGGKPMVSAVGGYRFYGVTRWIDGFRAGAHKADPHVVFRVDYSNDFANPSKCRRLALSQIAAGSRVVFNVAGVCGVGALRAAAQRAVWGVGVDIDQSFLGPYILTSAVSRYDRGVFDTIRRFVRGKLGPARPRSTTFETAGSSSAGSARRCLPRYDGGWPASAGRSPTARSWSLTRAS